MGYPSQSRPNWTVEAGYGTQASPPQGFKPDSAADCPPKRVVELAAIRRPLTARRNARAVPDLDVPGQGGRRPIRLAIKVLDHPCDGIAEHPMPHRVPARQLPAAGRSHRPIPSEDPRIIPNAGQRQGRHVEEGLDLDVGVELAEDEIEGDVVAELVEGALVAGGAELAGEGVDDDPGEVDAVAGALDGEGGFAVGVVGEADGSAFGDQSSSVISTRARALGRSSLPVAMASSVEGRRSARCN